MMRARRGMTLMELVIGLAITGMMATAGAAAFGSIIDHRRVVRTASVSTERAAALRDMLRGWINAGAIQIQQGGGPRGLTRGAPVNAGRGGAGARHEQHRHRVRGAGERRRDHFHDAALNPSLLPNVRIRLYIDGDANTPEKGLTIEYQPNLQSRSFARCSTRRSIHCAWSFSTARTRRWFGASQAATITPRAVRLTLLSSLTTLPPILGLPMIFPMGAANGPNFNFNFNAPAPMRARRGFALLAALWLVVAIAAVALQFSLEARERRTIGILASERGIQHAAALGATRARAGKTRGGAAPRSHSGRDPGLARLRATDPWFGVDSVFSGHRERRQHGRSTSQVHDLGEKLNINRMTEVQLQTFFSFLLKDFSKSTQLSQAIMDWRDADSIPRPSGAERDAYIKAEMLALPTNAPFREIEELQRRDGNDARDLRRRRLRISRRAGRRIK